MYSEIQFRPLHEICIVPDFTAISAHLGQAGDPRFCETAAMIAFYNLAEIFGSVLGGAAAVQQRSCHQGRRSEIREIDLWSVFATITRWDSDLHRCSSDRRSSIRSVSCES